jgi:hypothetical protein
MTIQVRRENEMLGRFVLAETKALLASGTLKDTDWACPEGSKIWVRLGSLVASQEVKADQPKATAETAPVEVRQPSPAWRSSKSSCCFVFSFWF